MISLIYKNIFKTVVRSGAYPLKLSSYRLLHGKKRNYYEILSLNKNCSSKDIKRAYIDLSKKFHPDKNNNVDSQHFLDVSEAYSVLSKEDLRRNYDLTMFPRPIPKRKTDHYYEEACPNTGRNPMDDPAFYHNRDKSKDAFYEAKPYYGIKGVPRMSNSVILFACLVLMAVGITVQVFAINHSFTFRKEEMMYRSNLASQSLENSRKQAEQNGNQLQIAILEEKFRSLE